MKNLLFLSLLFMFSVKGSCQLFEKKNDPFYRSMQITYVALNTADYFLTMNILSKGGKEANPIAKPVVGFPLLAGISKILVVGGTLWLNDIWLYKENPKLAKWSLVGLNILYGTVVRQGIVVTISLNGKYNNNNSGISSPPNPW